MATLRLAVGAGAAVVDAAGVDAAVVDAADDRCLRAEVDDPLGDVEDAAGAVDEAVVLEAAGVGAAVLGLAASCAAPAEGYAPHPEMELDVIEVSWSAVGAPLTIARLSCALDPAGYDVPVVGATILMARRSSCPTEASVPSRVGFWSAVCARCPAAHADVARDAAIARPQHTRASRVRAGCAVTSHSLTTRERAPARALGPGSQRVRKRSGRRPAAGGTSQFATTGSLSCVLSWEERKGLQHMTFKVGETVVYPHHGAALIEAIEERLLQGVTKTYLRLKVAQGDLTVLVPAENAEIVGVRDVVGQEGLDRVFEVLRAPHTEEPTNWSRRYKANGEKLASGDVNKVAEVVRDLWRRDRDRGLSAGEKRMLAKARQILTSELALAEGTNEDKAEIVLDEVLSEAVA